MHGKAEGADLVSVYSPGTGPVRPGIAADSSVMMALRLFTCSRPPQYHYVAACPALVGKSAGSHQQLKLLPLPLLFAC